MRTIEIVILLGQLIGCGSVNISVPASAFGTDTSTATATGTATGASAPHAVALEWADPDTGASWQLVADSVTFDEAVCPASWSMPETVIPAKFADYLLSHAGLAPAGGTYWTPIEGTIGRIVRSVESDGLDIFDVAETSRHMLICAETLRAFDGAR